MPMCLLVKAYEEIKRCLKTLGNSNQRKDGTGAGVAPTLHIEAPLLFSSDAAQPCDTSLQRCSGGSWKVQSYSESEWSINSGHL
jgi:hypothetical protein